MGLSLTVGCFLNIGRDHISSFEHESAEDYFASKLKIFNHSHMAVVNLNSARVQEIIDAAQKSKDVERIVTFGVNRPDANYCATNLRSDSGRVEFDLTEKFDSAGNLSGAVRPGSEVDSNTTTDEASCEAPQNSHEYEYRHEHENEQAHFAAKISPADGCTNSVHIDLGMAGLFNVDNALAAIAMARIAGISFEHIVAGLQEIRVPGRMELVVSPDKRIVAIVDYAHNKLSFETLFKSVKAEYPHRKIISVFGAAGDKAKERRYELPEVAGAYSDLMIFTEEDPAHERVEDICAELAQNAPEGSAYEIICDREQAIKRAMEVAAKEPSVVLLLAKGAETRQHRGDDYPTVKSDLEIARELLLD